MRVVVVVEDKEVIRRKNVLQSRYGYSENRCIFSSIELLL